MRQSEQVNELFTALAKAQGEFTRVAYDKKNPHFKSQYASLEAIIDATRDPLSRHGLAVLFLPYEEAGRYHMEVRLGHVSGQWISCSLPLLLDKSTQQSLGSAMTYARRYGICSILCISGGEDDDAEEAEKEQCQNLNIDRKGRSLGTISNEQIKALEALLANDPKLKDKVLAAYNIEKLEQMPESIYSKALSRILASLEQTEKVA